MEGKGMLTPKPGIAPCTSPAAPQGPPISVLTAGRMEKGSPQSPKGEVGGGWQQGQSSDLQLGVPGRCAWVPGASPLLESTPRHTQTDVCFSWERGMGRKAVEKLIN